MFDLCKNVCVSLLIIVPSDMWLYLTDPQQLNTRPQLFLFLFVPAAAVDLYMLKELQRADKF